MRPQAPANRTNNARAKRRRARTVDAWCRMRSMARLPQTLEVRPGAESAGVEPAGVPLSIARWAFAEGRRDRGRRDVRRPVPERRGGGCRRGDPQGARLVPETGLRRTAG